MNKIFTLFNSQIILIMIAITNSVVMQTMVKATRYFYINKNILLKPFISLDFVFLQNKHLNIYWKIRKAKCATVEKWK